MLKLTHRGDTIVEVLLAIVIIGSVLVISYTTASRNVRIGQQTQERTVALKLVEGQLERLKQSSLASNAVFGMVGTFCMRDSDNAPVSAPSADCTKGPIPNGYRLAITPPVGGNRTFVINAVWDSIMGRTDNIKMTYKVNPL